jgi:hypothetical protein
VIKSSKLLRVVTQPTSPNQGSILGFGVAFNGGTSLCPAT